LEELIAVLKEGNVDLSQKNEFGNTPLDIACNPIYDTNVEIIKLLLKYPLDINSRGLDDITPLMYAIMKRDITVVNILIEMELM